MKPPTFDYVRAESVQEAVQTLAANGDEARVLAGGQSLMAMLNMRLLHPSVIVDIGAIDALNYVRIDGDEVEIGAAMTQAELWKRPECRQHLPLLTKALPHIGHWQTRNRGTICGSLAHADPSSELPLCLAVTEGSVVLESQSGRRVIKADDFQTGMLSTAKREDEMLIAARFPKARPGIGYGFSEFARRHGDFAIVAVAAVADGSTIRVAVGGIADRPAVLRLGDTDAMDEMLNRFAWELGGTDDIHATAKLRRNLVRTLGKKTIEDALACRG
ncbi:MAG: FAD binding domain-containing protein [Gammaproteobacteria bacterium]|nr:FAD binding domain-containing protein [Gammaproteobacteria bacterium]